MRPGSITKRTRKIPRSAALLLGVLVLIVISPSLSFKGGRLVAELIFDVIFMTGVYAVGLSRHRWAFAGLSAITLAVRWTELLHNGGGLDVLALGLTAIWLAYAASVIIVDLFQRSDVNSDTILGAIVTYLPVGIAFMMVFQVLELRYPGSFSGLPEGAHDHRHAMASSMMYFSLVCLTTMGYGDIAPVTDFARPLSVLEGVFGQLYLAVMIARLVGLHITRQKDG